LRLHHLLRKYIFKKIYFWQKLLLCFLFDERPSRCDSRGRRPTFHHSCSNVSFTCRRGWPNNIVSADASPTTLAVTVDPRKITCIVLLLLYGSHEIRVPCLDHYDDQHAGWRRETRYCTRARPRGKLHARSRPADRAVNQPIPIFSLTRPPVASPRLSPAVTMPAFVKSLPPRYIFDVVHGLELPLLVSAAVSDDLPEYLVVLA
jgi:hypothetical protein